MAAPQAHRKKIKMPIINIMLNRRFSTRTGRNFISFFHVTCADRSGEANVDLSCVDSVKLTYANKSKRVTTLRLFRL